MQTIHCAGHASVKQGADLCDVGRRESVVLKDLKDCSVYLLDYSGEVEVTNVQDSQIFIGRQLTSLCLQWQKFVFLSSMARFCCHALFASSTIQWKSMCQAQQRSRTAFAGPVDGPAIFDNVKGCHISVAAQQLQVRGSQDSEFAVYSANKPTIEHSAGA